MTADKPHETEAKQGTVAKYKALTVDDNLSSLERLRMYCSLAMSGEDWLEVEPFFDALLVDQQRGWLEAAIAWEVCGSIHRTFAKGKDPLFTKRHEDFVKHAKDARANVANG